MARYRTGLVGLVSLLCGLGWSAGARAYEDQATLDLSSGLTVVAAASTLAPVGIELGAGGSIGLSDLFVGRALLSYAPMFEGGRVQHLGRARVEAAYLLDVLKLVPFFGLGGSAWLYDAGGSPTVRPGGHLLLGLDYLWSRTWIVGIDVRIGLLVEPGGVASTTDVGLRASRVFELF